MNDSYDFNLLFHQNERRHTIDTENVELKAGEKNRKKGRESWKFYGKQYS